MMYYADIGSHCREKHHYCLKRCTMSACVSACGQANIQLSVYGGLNGKDLGMSITPAQPPDGSPWSTYGLFQPTFQVQQTNSDNILGIFPQKKKLAQLKQLVI